MEVIITYQEKMYFISQQLEKTIKELKQQLQDLPDGKLLYVQNDKYSKWYQRTEQGVTYIPKKNRALAEKLALKQYLSLQIQDLQQEKLGVDMYLRHCPKGEGEAIRWLKRKHGIGELIGKFFKPSDIALDEWSQMPYQNNTSHSERLIFKSPSGHMVRSKSELLIDIALYTNKIPFRYECVLKLDENLFYPDFTIRHPHTGAFFYWEHFGMMDNSDYACTAFKKLQIYSENEIYPNINLITTYETKEYPLSYESIEELIRHHFL